MAEKKNLAIGLGVAAGVAGLIYLVTKPEAAECVIDADCPPGYKCVNGKCVPEEAPPGAEIVLTQIKITPTEVYVGTPVEIRVVVANTGGVVGSRELALKINGTIVETRTVSREPGLYAGEYFYFTPEEPGTYEVEVNGEDKKTGSFVAIAGEVSGEILEIMWRLSTVDEWHPTSDPMPAYTDVRYRFIVRNTGAPAKFKAGYYHENYGAGWRYSSPITIDTGEEGEIIWAFGTGEPRGTFDFTWYLFGDSKQIDSVVVATTIVEMPPPPPPPPPIPPETGTWRNLTKSINTEKFPHEGEFSGEVYLPPSRLNELLVIWFTVKAEYEEYGFASKDKSFIVSRYNNIFAGGWTRIADDFQYPYPPSKGLTVRVDEVKEAFLYNSLWWGSDVAELALYKNELVMQLE